MVLLVDRQTKNSNIRTNVVDAFILIKSFFGLWRFFFELYVKGIGYTGFFNYRLVFVKIKTDANTISPQLFSFNKTFSCSISEAINLSLSKSP
jgi:hypothetical protein